MERNMLRKKKMKKNLEFFVNVLVDLFAVDASKSAENDYGRFGSPLGQKPSVAKTIQVNHKQ